jgi:hypothetical protein
MVASSRDLKYNKNQLTTFKHYFGDEIRIMTKIFKKNTIKIVYCTNNTIKNNCKISTRKDKYNACGVYEFMLDVSTKVCWTDRLGLTTTVFNEINTMISVNRAGNTFSSMCTKIKIILKKHQCYSTVYLVNIYMENTTKTNIRGSRQTVCITYSTLGKPTVETVLLTSSITLYIMRHNTDDSLSQTSTMH